MTTTFSSSTELTPLSVTQQKRQVMHEVERKHFDWERYFKRHAQLIEQCLGPNKGVKKGRKR